jgi:hypothetical protein
MKVKKHTNMPKKIKVWYTLDATAENGKRKFFATLNHWGIIEQVNTYTFWQDFEKDNFNEEIVSKCATKVDDAFRRAIDVKENLIRSLERDNSINEDILQNTLRFVKSQLKDLQNDHFQIQNNFKDIIADIILKQME